MMRAGGRLQRSRLPAEAALGAAAGLSLWVGSWVLHTLVHPEVAAVSDPLFWVLGFAPITLAGFGWLVQDNQQTQVRAVELERRTEQQSAEIETREALRRSVLADSFDAVVLVEVSGGVVEANRAACELFGYTVEEFGQMRIGQLLPDVARDQTVHETPVSSDLPRIDWRTRGRHADGGFFPLQVHLSRTQSMFVYTLREVSDRLGERLEELQSGRKVLDQRRRSASLQDVVSAMRGRLSEVIHWIDRAAADGVRPARIDELVELADDLVHETDELANVMMWDRVDASPTIGPVDVRTLLDQILTELRPLPHLRHDRLEVEVDDSVGEIVTDPSQIATVLRNLVSHELRRVRDGTLWVEVLREPGRGTDWVTTAVHHVGREMSLEEIDQIHHSFAMSTDPHPVRELLGLALGQRLARALGGHLAVESVPGQGTTLSLRLPVDPTKVKQVPVREPRPMESPGPAPTSATPGSTPAATPGVALPNRPPSVSGTPPSAPDPSATPPLVAPPLSTPPGPKRR